MWLLPTALGPWAHPRFGVRPTPSTGKGLIHLESWMDLLWTELHYYYNTQFFSRLFLPLALQHMSEFVCCENLSRRLATSCAKKAAAICSVLSDTTLRTLNQPAVFAKTVDRNAGEFSISFAWLLRDYQTILFHLTGQSRVNAPFKKKKKHY